MNSGESLEYANPGFLIEPVLSRISDGAVAARGGGGVVEGEGAGLRKGIGQRKG